MKDNGNGDLNEPWCNIWIHMREKALRVSRLVMIKRVKEAVNNDGCEGKW